MVNKLNFGTLYELLVFAAENYSDNTAFIDGSKAVTYKEFYNDVLRAVNNLKGLGCCGKHIAIGGLNSYGWVVSYFACAVSGVVMPVADECEADEIDALCQRADCVLFIDANYSGDTSGIVKTKSINWKSLLAPCLPAEDIAFPKADDVAAFIPTSGTMGKSRICMLTHKSLCADIISASLALDFSGSTVTVLPFHHSYGMLGGVFLGMVRGAKAAICREVRYMTATVLQHPPRFMFVVPAIAEGLYKDAKRFIASCIQSGDNEQEAFSKACNRLKAALGGRCEILVIGGAPLSAESEEFFRKAGVGVCPGYGLTECSPAVSVNPPFSKKSRSVGPALPSVKVTVLNPDEKGEGELVINGDIVMKGYYKDPVSDSEVFSRHGLLTGDIGRIDDDGYIYITGRKKNLIILANGKNVMPEEIEALLDALPTVNESLVFDSGSVIGARIYSNDFEKCKAEIDALNATLPMYKRISKTEFVSTPLPRNALKKLIRKI